MIYYLLCPVLYAVTLYSLFSGTVDHDATHSFLYIWDLQTNTQIGNTHTIQTTSTLFYHPANLPIIADFDGDNKPEIGVCGNLVFQVVEDYETDISGTRSSLEYHNY